MKNIYFYLLIFCLFYFRINAQTTDVVIGLNWPNDMALNGNDLYFADDIVNKIYKIDITDPSSTPAEVVSLAHQPYRILLNGNNLYISMYDESQLVAVISKIDITDANPVPVEIISGLYISDGIAIYNNYLYIVESGAGRIIKINITETTPNIQEVISGLQQPSAIIIIGNDLYFTTVTKVSKFNITETIPTLITVASGLSTPTGLVINGNDLYITNSSGGRVSKIDITETVPNIQEVISGLNFPRTSLVTNNQLYITESGAGKIIKLDISSLSIIENQLNNPLKLFPNPSNNFLQFTKLNVKSNYKIYNSIGQKVMEGHISENEKLNIQNLSAGLYIIELNNQNRMKFIKN